MTESLTYRSQCIDLLCKSIEWFLYDRDLRQERVYWDYNTIFKDNSVPIHQPSFASVSIVNFEQVNVSWEKILPILSTEIYKTKNGINEWNFQL